MCNAEHHPIGCNCGFGPAYPKALGKGNAASASTNDTRKGSQTTPAARKPPCIRTIGSRTASILGNKPARFPCAPNPGVSGRAPLWRSHRLGVEAITKYGKMADLEAQKQGADPIMVKAILYYENADGHKCGLDETLDTWGLSRSQKPMSLRSDIWGGLGVTRYSSPRKQIRAAVTLIKRITERLDNPTPERIGTLWNSLSATKVTERGARIGSVYEDEPWTCQD